LNFIVGAALQARKRSSIHIARNGNRLLEVRIRTRYPIPNFIPYNFRRIHRIPGNNRRALRNRIGRYARRTGNSPNVKLGGASHATGKIHNLYKITTLAYLAENAARLRYAALP
jgi:hypothetical protein